MLKAGDRIDRYVIDALLGQGGMGEVYAAVDTRLGRRVALKVIRGEVDKESVERLLREARAAAAFEHPNAVVVFDVGEAEGAPFLAMELVRGQPLRALVGDGAIPMARRLRWLVDAARALGAAHRAGLVHRDVKPDNVMIREDGAVKVLDFGIARREVARIDPSAPTSSEGIQTLTAKGVVVGTPLYAAPEQLRSEATDGRADQFSWAVMAYELCAGSPPWKGETSVAVLSQILSGEAPSLVENAPGVSEEVGAAIARALAKRPDDRFPNIDAAADAIEAYAEAPRTYREPLIATRSPSGAPIALAETAAAIESAPRAAETQSQPPATLARRALKRSMRIAIGVLASLGALIVLGIVVAAVQGGNLYISVSSNKDAGVDGGARPTVVSLGCRDATVEGEGASPEIARALGIGACARLATELGAGWGTSAGATPLEVHAVLAKGAAEVTLTAAGRSASAKAKKPLEAASAAARALSQELTTPPMTSAEINAWGAKDEASARHIDRVWRRLIIDVSTNPDAEVKELIAADPDAPWPHGFATLLGLRGADNVNAEREKALAHVDKLPPARQSCLRGIVLSRGTAAERREATKMMRKAYTEGPDDPLVRDLYAAVLITGGNADEGYAALERLYARDPTRSIVALNNAILGAPDRDLDRDQKLLDRLTTTLPETSAWYANVRQLVVRGHLDEARVALDFGTRLGMHGGDDADATNLAATRGMVELAALDAKAARAIATPMLADPQVQIATQAAVLTIASYWIEGRAVDALSAESREMERQRTNGSPLVVLGLVADEARSRRWLGAPLLAGDRLALLDAGQQSDANVTLRSAMMSEAALLHAAIDKKPIKALGEEALRRIEQLADETGEGDRAKHDAVIVRAIALIRAVRGDAEAARVWRETARASFEQRRVVALDAALALEASGDREGAEQAYLLAEDALDIEENALMAMIAHARLADLYRATKRASDAAREDALVDKAWAGADSGVRDAVHRLK